MDFDRYQTELAMTSVVKVFMNGRSLVAELEVPDGFLADRGDAPA